MSQTAPNPPAAPAAPSSAASNPVIEELLAPPSDSLDPHERLAARQRKGRKEKYIASGAHPGVQRILEKFPSGNALGEAAIKIIKLQLALRKLQVDADRALALNEDGADERQLRLLSSGRDYASEHAANVLKDAKALARRFGQSPQQDEELLKEFKKEHAAALRSRAITSWTRLPFSAMVQTLPDIAAESDEIDEWIISNECFMRALLSISESEYRQAARGDAAGNGNADVDGEAMWKSWLLKLGSPASESLFGKPDNKESYYTVERPKDLPGLGLLDGKRSDSIRVRTHDSFKTEWESATGGVLNGLDWNNVFVAGGIVLSVLTGSFDEKSKESYMNSDIDLYVYGLSPEEATAKLLHIEQVFKTNINKLYSTASQKPGAADDAEPPYAVLRNSKTITLLPQFPHRRVQIILKMCANPMEVVLNFDLDQVAMGYDGSDVYMLPRAARALVTGYSTFTMDLIQGHFLNDRRSTQDHRTFKYASRGFGIRFLPVYREAVRKARPKGYSATPGDRPGYHAGDDVRRKVKKIIEIEKSESLLEILLNDSRNKMDWFTKQTGATAHAEIDGREMNDADIGRGSLANFHQFARHVALYEFELDDVLQVIPAYSSYEEDPDAYTDGPDYDWVEKVSLRDIQKLVKEHGAGDANRLFQALSEQGVMPETSYSVKWSDDSKHRAKRQKAATDHLTSRPYLQRVTWSTSMEDALKEKLVCAVYAPDSFIELARKVLPASDEQLQNAVKKASRPKSKDTKVYSMVYFHIPLTWQLVDRVKDEVVEMLQAFRRAHATHPQRTRKQREQDAVRQISRRAPRPTPEAEIAAFADWAGKPNPEYINHGMHDDREWWMMLAMDFDITANRFILPLSEIEQIKDDITRYQPRLYLGEGDEWFKASARKALGKPLPYPTGEDTGPSEVQQFMLALLQAQRDEDEEDDDEDED